MTPIKDQQKILDYGAYTGLDIENSIQKYDMTIFRDLVAIFIKLQGYKYNSFLSSTKFRKLSMVPFMTNNKILKVDYDILFKKI